MSTFLSRATLDAAAFAGVGFLYSAQTGIPANLVVGIAFISRISNRILKYIVYSHSKSLPERGANYASTNFIVNALTIAALNHFNLIAAKGICVLGSLALINATIIYKRGYREPSMGELMNWANNQ